MDKQELSIGEIIASRLIAAGAMDFVPAEVCKEITKYYALPKQHLQMLSLSGNMFARVVLDFKEANKVK